MAVSHFPSKAAAQDHLIRKGFQHNDAIDLWVTTAAQVHARVMDSVRGWHVFFYEAA